MGELYKKLFKVILICGIITLISGEIFLMYIIGFTGVTSREAFNEAQELTESGREVNDMTGYGALIDYIGSGLMKIIQILALFFSIGFLISVVVYLILYYISFRLFKNGETKDKMSGSILLISIALFMKISFVLILSKIIIINAIQDITVLFKWPVILVLIPYISEIVSIIFTIIFYIKNLDKIKGIYSERIEKNNEC